MKKRIIILFVMILVLSSFVSAANVYIDPSATYNGDGTKGVPAICNSCPGAFNTWSSVSFDPTKDYYQKCGTTYTTSSYIYINDKIATADDRTILGAYYLNDDNEVIGVSGEKPIIYRNNDDGSTLLIRMSNYITVQDLDIRGGYKCVSIQGSDYITFENCNIGEGAYQYGFYISIYSGDPSYPQSDYGIINDCEIDSKILEYGQVPYDAAGKLQDGIKLGPGASHWEVHGNTIKDWGHNGVNILSNGGYGGATASYNKIHDNFISGSNSQYMRGLGVQGPQGLSQYNEIYYNYIKDTTVRNQINGNNNLVYYNIIDTVKDSGLKSYNTGQGISMSGFGADIGKVNNNNKIYNNIIANCDSYGIYLAGTTDYYSDKYDNIIANNIIYNCGIGENNISLRVYDTSKIYRNKFQNNIVYSLNTNNVINYRGTTMTVESFNSADESNDVIENNLGSNPEFVNPENRDFHLLYNSLAIDAGVDVGLTEDFDGNPVPIDGDGDAVAEVDIGAFEYQGTEPSCHQADTNCDNCIDITELMAYVSQWKTGSVSISDLMEAIGEWKNGC